ncbi:MAG: penicillin-binding transpeptidase domain-containing protein, partial [Methyloceanibacter sp.]
MAPTARPDPAAARAERASLARGRYRFRLACLAFALSFALIAARLVTLGFAATGPGAGGVFDISSTVHRPDVFDRSGSLLATDIKGATLFADPNRVIDADEFTEQVASVLPDIDQGDLRTRIKQGRRFVRIKRELTPKQQAEIHELGLPGVGFIDEYRRVYPMGATASHVVGLVNVDSKGLAGVEKFIDDNPQLAMTGSEGVALSLDLGVQHVLREELGRAIAAYRAKAAAGIVIDVHSGEVMALASLPDYDPNHREQALDKERLNRIGFGVYEMGSVFKVFTVAGVLDGGQATLRSHYDASSPIHYA